MHTTVHKAYDTQLHVSITYEIGDVASVMEII